MDPDNDSGEIFITIPPHVIGTLVVLEKFFDISVEYSIEEPTGGLHFVIPECEGTLADVSEFKL